MRGRQETTGRSRGRRAWQPEGEWLEDRQLLSLVSAVSSRRTTFPSSSNGSGTGSPYTQAATTLTSIGQGVPSPHELALDQFTAKFFGGYIVAPGRTSDFATTVKLTGPGSYTDILHANLDSVLSTPRPGTATPAAQGVLLLSPINSGSTGSLALRVQGAPGDLSLPTPTQFTWTVDPLSSGAFANAVGQGTVTIHYFPSRPLGHGFGQGRYFLEATGTLIRSGLA